jgi:hypothetical protein
VLGGKKIKINFEVLTRKIYANLVYGPKLSMHTRIENMSRSKTNILRQIQNLSHAVKTDL